MPRVLGSRTDEVVLTALAQAFHAWTGAALLLDLEGHGREALFDDVDLSRTVGWFTCLFPLVLAADPAAPPAAALAAVSRRLRQIPAGGVGFGLLRYFGGAAAAARLAALPQAEVSFNYLGRIDQALPAATPFALAPESPGPAQSRRALRRHLLEVTCQVADGQFGAEITYSPAVHSAATVQALAERFLAALRRLLAQCGAAEQDGAPGYTPADFPLMNLSQQELDELLDDASGVLQDR